jgi:hypothetical protein
VETHDWETSMSLPTGPWTHGDVMLLHIFLLLFVWFLMDRFDFKFTDIPHYWYMFKLYYGAWRNRPRKTGNWTGPR